MTSISAVIITKNEELNIERCIRSMSGIADEILVVDSFSTDRTESICHDLGVKFIQHKFQGYGPQKQYAVSQAKYDWILSLDADEEISDQLKDSILKIKEGDDPQSTTAFSFTRENYYCKKLIRFIGWGNDNKTRLFNRLSANWSDNLVHETVNTSHINQITHLEGALNHYTFNSVEQHKQKTEGYAQLGAMEVQAKGKNYSQPIVIIKAIYRFVLDYIIKLGILDGYYGFKISQMNAYYVYLKYSGGKK